MISPMKYFGLIPPPGFNCWAFVCMVYEREFAIALNPHCINCEHDPKACATAAKSELESKVWNPAEFVESGTLVLMTKNGLRYHVGVAISNSMVIHWLDGSGVIVQSISDLSGSYKTLNFFSHVNLCKR